MNRMRRKGAISRQVSIGVATGLIMLAAVAATAIWAMERATYILDRADHSHRQMEIAAELEAAFNRYLTIEITRRIRTGAVVTDGAEMRIRDLLQQYGEAVTREVAFIEDPEERRIEETELVRATALNDIFEAIAVDARRITLQGNRFSDAAQAREFMFDAIAGRDETFRAVIFEILQDERGETVAQRLALTELTRTLWLISALVAALALAAAAFFAVSLHRSILQPVRIMVQAARDFGQGAYDRRIDAPLPDEFDDLAGGFNDMADQIETQQAELADANAHLQEEVAHRTADLEAVNERLRDVDATRRRFFANVSHELRTPVTVMLGEAQIALRNGGEPEAMREALDRIAASGGFLRRRLDDLMKLARSDEGELTLTFADHDVGQIVRSATDIARAYASSNEVSLKAATPDGAVTARVDAEAIRQCLLALIDNAVKFSPPGGRIDVALASTGAGARITVADQGPGFSQEDAEALFSRYQQQDNGRHQGGAGLGLAIARWITDQHGGTISAAPIPEGGALFTIELIATSATGSDRLAQTTG